MFAVFHLQIWCQRVGVNLFAFATTAAYVRNIYVAKIMFLLEVFV